MKRRLLNGSKFFLIFALGFTALVLFIGAIIGSVVVNSAGDVVSFWNNAPTTLPTVQINQHTIMYDKNGKQFAETWTEDRKEVKDLSSISKYLPSGVISAEDKGFYSHGAIDVVATLRSLLRSSGGGSGITQQLMKNLIYYNSNSTKEDKAAATKVTISRKVKELKLAMNYEKTHSKDEILLTYLNTVAMGSPNTYGVETAAETIFSKSAKDLTIGESAALAGSINNPSLYNMMNMDDSATANRVKTRQKYVLDRMLEDGSITQKEHDTAVKEPITTHVKQSVGGCGASKYPFYCQYVINWLLNDKELGSTAEERAAKVSAGGLEIHTNLDPDMTDKLNAQLISDWGVTNRVVQASAVVEPGTGAVLAIGANRTWGTDASKGETQMVLANSPTQTGSTYKMMTLAAALNAGWTEQQLMTTVSSACPWSKAGFEVPIGGVKNSASCRLQGGQLSYLQATAYSSNTWFSELESRVGVLKVKEFSGKVGLSTPDNITASSISYTLGTTDNTPINMAAAYATFANKGVYCPATPISSLKMINGSAIEPPDDYDAAAYSCQSVMSPKSASIVLKAQNANVNGDISGRFGEDAAISGRTTVGKSGTTDNNANSAWVQTVGQFVVFSDAYDPRGNFQYPLNSITWRGIWTTPNGSHAVLHSTRDFIVSALGSTPDVSLDMTNQDSTFVKTKVKYKDMVQVPNLTGQTPDAALKTLKSLGLTGAVLKDTTSAGSAKNNSSYPSGIVTKQSVNAGTMLIIGSKKTIELTVTH
jgi:membrane peptidoglycan carboxypeptidase